MERQGYSCCCTRPRDFSTTNSKHRLEPEYRGSVLPRWLLIFWNSELASQLTLLHNLRLHFCDSERIALFKKHLAPSETIFCSQMGAGLRNTTQHNSIQWHVKCNSRTCPVSASSQSRKNMLYLTWLFPRWLPGVVSGIARSLLPSCISARPKQLPRNGKDKRRSKLLKLGGEQLKFRDEPPLIIGKEEEDECECVCERRRLEQLQADVGASELDKRSGGDASRALRLRRQQVEDMVPSRLPANDDDDDKKMDGVTGG